MTKDDRHFSERPLAATGLTSYRYPGRYGWIMIGACDDEDALRQAERSLTDDSRAVLSLLEKYNNATEQYAPVAA
jgi:hypothetical protein